MITQKMIDNALPDDIHDGGISNVKWIDDNLYISIKPCEKKEVFLRFGGVTWIRSLCDENHNCYLKDTPYEMYPIIHRVNLNTNFVKYVCYGFLDEVTVHEDGVVFVNQILFFPCSSVERMEKQQFKNALKQYKKPPTFDLDQGKLSVRVSESVHRQILVDAENFNFKKDNGENNLNAFLNRLLPRLVEYRMQKRDNLRDFWENNFRQCIKENYQEEVFSILDDLFDTVYFSDRDFYHHKTLHFRLTKSNILSLQGFFDELERSNKNKTTYLRNLFNEYANMKLEQREILCFKEEYLSLSWAIDHNLSVNLEYDGEDYTLLPFALPLNYQDGSTYLIATQTRNPNVCHAFKLCSIRNVMILDFEETSYKHDENTSKKLGHIINEVDYLTVSTFNLNEINL